MSEFVYSVASGLHIGEFVGAFLLEVIEATNKADPCLAFNNRLVANIDGLDSRGTGTNWGFNRTGR